MTSPAMMRGIGQLNCDLQNVAAPQTDCGSLINEKLWAIHRQILDK